MCRQVPKVGYGSYAPVTEPVLYIQLSITTYV